MTDLTVGDFTDFYHAIHGYAPYPWQEALVAKIAEDGWPDTIDVPTGLGKTSAIDVAVFTAALNPERAPRRTFLVVDRRLVVDAAHTHAKKIRDALASPSATGAVATVAKRLKANGVTDPLTVTRMRGGTTWSRTWMEYPHAVGVITGTVDQIGSRALFRGYGVTPRARSIDAALTGTDSLILIDEAHLAESFTSTLSKAFSLDEGVTHRRPTIVTMSATSAPGTVVHSITDADRAHKRVQRILESAKTMHLVRCKQSKHVPAAMTAYAEQLATDGAVVLVVANTVNRAREIFESVRVDDKVLLTGRNRQPDRDRLSQIIMSKAKNGRDRKTPGAPFVIVATQTVEVGVDIDADHLVTESAALSSLIQRLGRLDRSGHALGTARAIVVHDGNKKDDDPVYGAARNATWQHLEQFTTVDEWPAVKKISSLAEGLPANVDALRVIADKAEPSVNPVARYTPVVLPRVLDMWTRTEPAPVPDPPVAPYLHGVDDSTAPVTIVWRGDIHTGADDMWCDAVLRMPPVAGEGIDVPIGAARAWLNGDDPTPVSDLDRSETPDEEPRPKLNRTAVAIGNEYRVVEPSKVVPGMTIVVPADYGGCDAYGWHPASDTLVVDVADIAHGTTLRIRKSTRDLFTSPHNPADNDQQSAVMEQLAAIEALFPDNDDDERDDPEPAKQVLTDSFTTLYTALTGMNVDECPAEDSVASWPLPTLVRRIAQGQPAVTYWESMAIDELDAPAEAWTAVVSVATTRFTSDDDSMSTSMAPQPLGLNAHQSAVENRAAEYATALRLPADIVDAIRIAARLHDEGKRDPRFQVMLHHGDPLLASTAVEPLAKSGMDSNNRAAFTRARRLARYPGGARHEELSARIATAHPDVIAHAHRDLIVHLVASHHGYARPLAPAVADRDNPIITVDGIGTFNAHEPVDLNYSETFHDLNRHYGPWGLALLETIVRLADQTSSRLNESGRTRPAKGNDQ